MRRPVGGIPPSRRKQRSIDRARTAFGVGDGRGGKAMAGHPGAGRDRLGALATVTARGAAVAESALRAAVSERLGESRFGLWFGDGVRLGLNGQGDALEVRVPDAFFRDWIGRHYTTSLLEA